MKLAILIFNILLTLVFAKQSVRVPRGTKSKDKPKNRRLKGDNKGGKDGKIGIPGVFEIKYKNRGHRKNCLGDDTLLYSCDDNEFVEANEVQIGNSLRTMTPHGTVCSDVYYKFSHLEQSDTLSFTLNGTESPLVFSDLHIVYIGRNFNERSPTLAKDVRIGDKLVTKEGPSKEVISVTPTMGGLVNILTFNPHLELKDGVIVSGYSIDETLNSILFAPFRMMYRTFGAKYTNYIIENTTFNALLREVDRYFSYSINIIS
mmetsp:Transcript_15768/g.18205  ORF Transcript_15768/g.18205 Transcript_15768/m.18205 type:complete len:260 (+) Transcript_15768:276-1055(+)